MLEFLQPIGLESEKVPYVKRGQTPWGMVWPYVGAKWDAMVQQFNLYQKDQVKIPDKKEWEKVPPNSKNI